MALWVHVHHIMMFICKCVRIIWLRNECKINGTSIPRDHQDIDIGSTQADFWWNSRASKCDVRVIFRPDYVVGGMKPDCVQLYSDSPVFSSSVFKKKKMHRDCLTHYYDHHWLGRVTCILVRTKDLLRDGTISCEGALHVYRLVDLGDEVEDINKNFIAHTPLLIFMHDVTTLTQNEAIGAATVLVTWRAPLTSLWVRIVTSYMNIKIGVYGHGATN